MSIIQDIKNRFKKEKVDVDQFSTDEIIICYLETILQTLERLEKSNEVK